jgi:predicted amidohydrolase YtcJ
MRAGGVRAGTSVPPKGVVCTDPDGAATGLLLEHAAYKVWEAAPEPTRDEVRNHVLAGLTALRALGYTEVHDLHSQEWLGPVLADLERSDQLPVDRVLLYPNVAKLEGAHATRARWESSRIRLAGGKLFADGTLNSRTALMLSPYQEPLEGLPLGQMMATPADIDRALELTESLGMHLAVHAIGDGAVRMVLDAWEKASRDRGIKAARGGMGAAKAHGRDAPPTHATRLRIEHCELIDAADVPRFATLGVVCGVQPCHLLTDIDVLTRQLPHRLDRVLPLRDLIDSGCTPAGPDGSGLLRFGSDVPIVRADPEDSIQAAVRRRRIGMNEGDAIGWSQRITDAEARACFGL